MKNPNLLAIATLTAALAFACGAEPSFLEKSSSDSQDAHAGGGQAGDATGQADGGDADGLADDAEPIDEGSGAGDGGDGGDGGEPLPEIPGAEDSDLEALHKCLSQWKNGPFQGRVDKYQKINAAITIGGFGNAVNDTESTAEPFLVLIDAGVNALGSPTYKLLNKNGYYCMKVNVNVLTTLNVELHCNARLADQRVNVNVGSQQSDTTSVVGVHVLSDVQVNVVRPQGDSCIR